MGYLYTINRSIMIQKALVIALKGSKIIFATEPEKLYLLDIFYFLFLDKGLADFLWHPCRLIFGGFDMLFPCLENVHFLCSAFP